MQSVQCSCNCKSHFVNVTEETHPAGVRQADFVCGDCLVGCQKKVEKKVVPKKADG